MELEYKINDNKYFNIKDILKSHFEISDKLLTKLKKNQKIFLNDIPVYINHNFFIGDTVKVNLDFEEICENILPTKMNLDILYEDEGLLIVNKPSGIPVHPSISHFEDSLSNGIKFYFDTINLNRKIRPVNRLDKDTSGIVVFAKNEYIQETLIKQMHNKKFKKEYYAIVEGFLEEEIGTIDASISRKEGSIIEREININGDKAITHFQLIKNFEYKTEKNKINIINQSESNIISSNTQKYDSGYYQYNDSQNYFTTKLSFVKFVLETGRTHQIRVHSKYIKHPILGDSLYGNKSTLISRQALHAYKITFIHPILKKEITIEANLPEDMKLLIS